MHYSHACCEIIAHFKFISVPHLYTQLGGAIAAMEVGTRYSRACCEIIAGEGGLSSLMRLTRVLNRSK